LVTLIEEDGILLNGDHEIGLFKYYDRVLAFKSVEQAERFLLKPAYYLEEFLVLCRKKPELIFLMRFEDYFRSKNLKLVHLNKRERQNATKIMVNMKLQTDTHIDPYIEQTYVWNAWVLRKQAIKMANIRNMSTKAA
jgi:Domain of unknown function